MYLDESTSSNLKWHMGFRVVTSAPFVQWSLLRADSPIGKPIALRLVCVPFFQKGQPL